MAFQESVDPLVTELEYLIDDLKKNIDFKEFQKTLELINEKFPFLNLLEFIEMYVDGTDFCRKSIIKF